MTTWLITGCSSGLGRSLAQAVLAQGHNAVVTARDPSSVEDIASGFPETALALALDVTKPDQVRNTVAEAQKRFGAIDVLVNNAGYGYRSAVEERDEADVDALFATNFFGAVAMINEALPGMRAQRSGAILNISSIGARRSMPGSGFYSATKFALEGMTEALKREVEPLGIKVMIVEPGPFRTDFSGRSLKGSKIKIDDYAATVGPRRIENDKTHGSQSGDPDRAALALLDIVQKPQLPQRLLLGKSAVTMVRDELQNQLKEIEEWAELSNSADFPESE